ncbi:hypothetical protein [Sphaerisporangium sp. NPDC051011]|uniref:protein kinase domain-containing protein n=1 Tax=Sphaerisporangium sp. NPDC051011 TaxID=3155792 RepID=UPI0033D6C3EA
MSTRRFPSGSQYVEALQNPNLCFTDPELRSATLQVDKLGRPKPISGNFASVFSVRTTSGTRYAIKCFTRDVPDQEKRYRAVSEHLQWLPHIWRMGFDYQPYGINVGGQRFPILRMEWVEAVSLIRWIEDHLGDQAALLDLAERFANLVSDLHRAGIAHGDLQHGNLLVAPDGTLKLVDYDGMYVPALAGLPATEHGHRHYQSPGRTGAEFGPELDRFSAWLIYLSLVAVALDPRLWQVLHEPGGEHLLLTDKDFSDVGSTSGMPALMGHQIIEIKRLASQVKDLASLPLTSLPPLTPLQVIGPSSNAGAASNPQSVAVTAVSPGLPAWMSGHMPTPTPPSLVAIQKRSGALLMARLALAGLSIILALIVWMAHLPEIAALLGPLLGIGVTRAIYASHPEPRERKPIASRLEAARRRAMNAYRTAANTERERDKIQAYPATVADTHAKELQGLKERNRQNLANYDRQTAQQLNTHDYQLQALTAKKSEELSRALHQLQWQHIDAYLRRIRLRPGSISGIGETTVANLAAYGISTPADFREVQYVATGYQTSEVHVILANGHSVRVPGVGESRAASLAVWREGHMQTAMRQPDMPNTLPTPQRRAIESRFVTEEHVLRDGRAQVEEGLQRGRTNLISQQMDALRQLTDRQGAAMRAAAQALQDVNQRLATLRAEHHAAVQEEQALARQLAAYRQITYRRFLRTILIGR